MGVERQLKGGMDHSIQSRSTRLRRLNFSEEGKMERIYIYISHYNVTAIIMMLDNNTIKFFKLMCSEFHINFIKFLNAYFFSKQSHLLLEAKVKSQNPADF